ncbi:MAG: GerAB/ArcD/ProY family transporter [Lawsonibacter sp.]|nr:GerAB/ArcD/ProY family transporter [Lawsonibacter sp.]
MQDGKISRTQLMALLWAGVMAPAAELLPALLLPGAGKGAWLAVVLAAPLVLAAGWLLSALSGQEGLARGLTAGLGKVFGRAVLLIYIVWGLLLLSLRLRLCAQRLLDSGQRDGALWFFLLAVAAVLLWMGRGKLAAFARAGQLFLAALLVTAGVVLGLSLFQARAERLLPLWLPEVGPVIRAALSAAGVTGWGLFAAFLLGGVADQGENRHWHWLFWGLGGMLLLAAAQGVILGNLGAGLAARLDNPFFALAKSVGVEGAFQRVEGVVTALWTFADLSMGGLLVFAIRAMAVELLSAKVLPWIPWGAVLIGTTGALFLFPAIGSAEDWNYQLVPAGNLMLGVVLPSLLWIVEKAFGKRKKKGTSCG